MSDAPRPRASIADLTAFIPGEPTRSDVIALEQFENPYPPPVEVIEELLNIPERKLRVYPDGMCYELRLAISTSFRMKSRQIFVTCGSNQVLRLLAYSYVEPGEKIACLWPTYLFYQHVADMCGAELVKLHWMRRTQEEALLDAPKDIKLAYIASPNPPIGYSVDSKAIEQFALERPSTLVVVDEAYCAFSGTSALRLVRAGIPNIVVTRTFSKSHSLAGIRVGFAMGQDTILAPLFALKEPYNVNSVSQVLGLAAWRSADWFAETVGKVTMTRSRMRLELLARGFDVPQSAGNFLFVRGGQTESLIAGLRERGILVRRMEIEELKDGFATAIGTEEEMDAVLRALDEMKDICPPPPAEPPAG